MLKCEQKLLVLSFLGRNYWSSGRVYLLLGFSDWLCPGVDMYLRNTFAGILVEEQSLANIISMRLLYSTTKKFLNIGIGLKCYSVSKCRTKTAIKHEDIDITPCRNFSNLCPKRQNSNSVFIRVYGWIFWENFPLKNPQISNLFQHLKFP